RTCHPTCRIPHKPCHIESRLTGGIQGMRKVRRRRWAVATAMLGVCLAAVPLATAAADTTGSISGVVTDAFGAPLAAICVTAKGPNIYLFGQTDAAGNYQLVNAPAGAYVVGFDSCRGGEYLPQWYDDKPDATSADAVNVTGGADTAGIDAHMTLAGSISGTITDRAGVPQSGACASARSGIGGHSSPPSDSAGHYRIPGLTTGTYVVSFYSCAPAGYLLDQWYQDKSSSSGADPVSVTTSIDTPGIDAHLDIGGAITGTVTDAAG